MFKLTKGILFILLAACLVLSTACSDTGDDTKETITTEVPAEALNTPNITSIGLTSATFNMTINWSITEDVDHPIDSFEIFIKAPGQSVFNPLPFQTVGDVRSFTTTNPLRNGFGTYQFRMKMVSTDGSFSHYSTIQNVVYRGFLNHTTSFGSDRLSTPYDCVINTSTSKLYIADTANHRILEYDADGTFSQAFGSFGSGLRQFHSPRGIALGSDGRIYVADSENDRVVRFNPLTFTTTFESVGGNGSAVGSYNVPVSLAFDSGGSLYVADQNNNRIQKHTISSTGDFALTSSTALITGLTSVSALAINGSDLFVLDKGTLQVKRYTTAGALGTTWGSLGSATAQFREPAGIAIDTANGNIFVSDALNDSIQVFDRTGVHKGTWGIQGADAGEFSAPRGMTYGSNKLFIMDSRNNRGQIFE